MRLIIFMRNIEGGVATYMRSFLQYRDTTLFYVKLVLVTDDQTGIDRVEDGFNADEVVYFHHNRYENIYHVLRRLSRHVEQSEDMIWANEGAEMTMVNLFRLPNKLINVIHGDSAYYYDNVSKYCGVADGFIASSDWILQKASSLSGLRASGSMIQKIFAPVKAISPGPEMKRDLCRMIYIGRIDQAKGAHHIPGICAALDKLKIPYVLTMAGSGDLMSTLAAANPKLNGEIKFTGFLSNKEVPALLADQQIMLFPSYSEAVGLAVVEAMKAGVVPVTSDLNSGLPEIVINGQTGYRVQIGDELAFAEKIAYLFQHPDRLHDMRLAAVQLANDQFDPVIQTGKIEAFLQKVYATPFEKSYNNNKYGFRLDSKYLPNAATIILRKIIAAVRLKKAA